MARANAPLPVKATGTDIIYPNRGQTNLNVKTGENIDFACPGARVVLNNLVSTITVQATCVSGENFTILGQRYQWSQIHCNEISSASSRFTNKSCVGGREAEIGFDLDNGRFIRQIIVCFDTTEQAVLYTQYDVVASIDGSARGTPRPLFTQDNGFYNIGTQTVNNLYVRGGQRRTINNLLGLSNTNTKYIQDGQLFFLSRGHLAARTDFFYPAQLNATFKYINAAPQWQSFNGYNWNQAEIDSRNYASRNNVNIQMWTGTYGVATLPHETTKRDTELYIYVNNNARGIPVPALYWKVVYNPVNKRGIVLIGLNNPYEKNVSKHVICPDISGSVSWLLWNKTSIEYGYSYACTIPEFRRVVSYAPNLTVTGLLV